MITGSCLCGGIRFEVDGPLEPIQVCHCGQCRKAQGTAFATNIPVPQAQFRVLQGEELLKRYSSSPGKQRCFCERCGSPIYSCNKRTPGVVRVRAGTLDGDLDTQLQAHFFTAHKANWFEISDGLPCYAEFAPSAQ
ncbi:GFA family protein [Halopseudomonas pachastrellae]|jgi:hypothetical protein|nr:GFA family protein [Halopseudomonas pachastrellae]WVM92918.1 GFA family protein [Halopseudomonas pachastrellae]